MMSTLAETGASSGGILFPLDMFRPSMLAQVLGEYFVSKARNVLDARVVLTRHPLTQLVLMRIDGGVVGEDEGAFWKEYSELALLLSRILPRQCVLYYAMSAPERREGFMVTQQGQALAANDVTADSLPPEATEEDWPVAQLCGQFGVTRQELVDGFPGGPSVSVALLEPTGDDRELLTTLAEPPEGYEAGEGEGPDGAAAPEGSAPARAGEGRGTAAGGQGVTAGSGQAPGGPPAGGAPKVDDAKRRAAERSAEREERAAKAAAAHDQLKVEVDDFGAIVALSVALEDTDIINKIVVRKVSGELPQGLPSDLTERLQGKRIDVAIPVEFLSEVFSEGAPLTKPAFEEGAESRESSGGTLKLMTVQAPRIGPGVLVRRERTGVFVSRPIDRVPVSFVVALLDQLD